MYLIKHSLFYVYIMALNKICIFYGDGLPLFSTTSLFDFENHIDLMLPLK